MSTPIKFKGYKIKEIILTEDVPKEVKEEFKDNKVSFKVGKEIQDDTGFIKQKIETIINGNYLKLVIIGSFELNREEFDNSDLEKILIQNGSAMLYPYVRTFLSVITSLDSPDVGVLPTLNFVDLFQKEDN